MSLPLNILTTSFAHQLATAIVEAQIPPPQSEVTGVAIVEHAGIRVFISVTSYDGPARLHLAPGCTLPLLPKEPTREIERTVLEAAPGPDQPAVTVAKLAKLAGYAHSSYFRDAVRKMINAGWLVRISTGIRKPAPAR